MPIEVIVAIVFIIALGILTVIADSIFNSKESPLEPQYTFHLNKSSDDNTYPYFAHISTPDNGYRFGRIVRSNVFKTEREALLWLYQEGHFLGIDTPHVSRSLG